MQVATSLASFWSCWFAFLREFNIVSSFIVVLAYLNLGDLLEIFIQNYTLFIVSLALR